MNSETEVSVANLLLPKEINAVLSLDHQQSTKFPFQTQEYKKTFGDWESDAFPSSLDLKCNKFHSSINQS
ncbi:hypothetical protein CEXT_53161 [Caerostris extrusa]|uniref:Uncharacterized protein n=1 Tax=Caerostris extrusa TaxID=172846 RepID=A0AAV4T6T0_CAEEX|nr:hypothetical protein CEXT_53161 [Caerostris extrusa]